jgi:N-acyl-D-aspartate/D-glutamate deacylase
MATGYEVIIRNGRWFDGLGSPSAVRHLGIRDGRVATISETPLPEEGCREVIDAKGRWVLPGFVDIHTHYDAEVLVAPGLKESVRHGVTTLFIGSCSLSTVYSSPLDCADLFSRVEAVPRDCVLAALEKQKDWSTPAEYVRHLESLPLGPNVAAFLGHSDLRTHVMGLGRAVDANEKPTEDELRRMESMLESALSQGFLGLSTMTSSIDKLDGDRFRSRPLPSTFASWSEYLRFNRLLRKAGRVLQSAPNVDMPANVLMFFLSSMGGWFRSKLKTSLLVAADSKAVPGVVTVAGAVTRFLNRFLGGEVRWQHIPVPFEIYADGIDLVVFEELGAGRTALHLKDEVERNKLFTSESYRRQFRRDYENRFAAKMWHRNFYDAQIIGCPDESVVGKSFGQVADERKIHPVDAFLDLVVLHGQKLRWKTLLANHRPDVLDRLATRPEIQLGFADSGAHLRNMAFYNAPVRFLRRVVEAESRGRPFLSPEQAVKRLTSELADWYDLDAGTLCEGDRADIVIIDPQGLDASVDAYHEERMPEFNGMSRMVNRSDSAVKATLINGQWVFRDGAFRPGYGETQRTGRFLRAGTSHHGTSDAKHDATRANKAAA